MTSLFGTITRQPTLYQSLRIILLFIIVFIMNHQQQYDDQLQLQLKLICLMIQIDNHHTNYNTAICKYINNSTFTIKSINHTITSKCKYTPTSPTGASIFSSRTINHRNQLHIQHFIVSTTNSYIQHMNWQHQHKKIIQQ